jgi:NitT/TauT family transport system substrate-binding protein
MLLLRLVLGLAVLMLPGVASGQGGKPAPPVKIDFHIDWTPGPDYAGFYVAREKGMFKRYGLDVNIVPGNGAEDAVQLLSVGKAKVGTTTADAVLRFARAKPGRTPLIAAVIFPRNPVMIALPQGIAIRSLTDLKSMRVGYSQETSVTYRQFRHALQNAGLMPDHDLKLEKVLWDGPRKLESGEIDAVLGYTTDVPVELSARRFPHQVIPLERFGMAVAGQVVALSPDHGLNREIVDKLLQATAEGWEYARANPEETAALLIARFPTLRDMSATDKVVAGLRETYKLLPNTSSAAAFDRYAGRSAIADALRRSDEIVARMLKSETAINLDALIWRQ